MISYKSQIEFAVDGGLRSYAPIGENLQVHATH